MIVQIQTVDPNSGYELCIYPQESRRKRAAWIMWICPDGSADLWTQRKENGALVGDPIKLPANRSRKTKVVQVGSGFFPEEQSKAIVKFEKAAAKKRPQK